MTALHAAPAASLRRWRGGLISVGVLAAILLALVAAPFTVPSVRGYALYHGFLPLAGRISGHGADLPAQASRCANCHDRPQAGTSIANSIAALDQVSLLIARERRGGPPSAYSEESFCKLLREGIDPAMIIVNRTMPRFAVSSFDCHALWRFVISR